MPRLTLTTGRTVTDQNLLSGHQIRLTGLRATDASVICTWREDTRFLRLWNSDPCVERGESQIVDWMNQMEKSERDIAFAIRHLEGEDIIGLVELDGIEWPNRVAGLGIGIGDPAHWDKGYGTEATRLIVNYAFAELNLYRLQLTVFEYNARAIAMYEKIGFSKEGVFRSFVERDGKRYDMLLYGLLRDEWRT